MAVKPQSTLLRDTEKSYRQLLQEKKNKIKNRDRLWLFQSNISN